MAMTVRLPDDLNARLTSLAEEWHVSKHALLLQAAELLVAREQRKSEITAGVDRHLESDAELLKRLADV
jgi:predicted transcriptional regulator